MSNIRSTEINRPGVHQIALEKNFDPVSLFRHGNDQPGGILDRHGFHLESPPRQPSIGE
jgi:hypothetical protein